MNRHQQMVGGRGAPGRSPRAPPADRAARYLARVDRHLPVLADDGARRAFLDQQLQGWERRYAHFIASGGASEPVGCPADPPQAADFIITITALAARRSALGADTGPKTMRNANPSRPLGRAILSLLVAADQRCPAIIGQAHVLHHARSGTTAVDAAAVFVQLQRDAADLFAAIADVEAAMKGMDQRPR